MPPPTDDPTRELLEIRHVEGATRCVYNAIYQQSAIDNLLHHRRFMLNLMDVRPGMRMLDVACGEAGLVVMAHEWGLDVQGIDLSDVALRAAHGHVPASSLVVANGEALPYADDSFDRVANIGSLEHYLDPLQGAREMARVLAPDGLACILLPNTFGLRMSVLYAWRHGEVLDDGQPLQRYGTRGQWTRLLAAGGFTVERVVGYESHRGQPRTPQEYVDYVRHPSRLLVPVAKWLPVDMASLLIFLCRKAAP